MLPWQEPEDYKPDGLDHESSGSLEDREVVVTEPCIVSDSMELIYQVNDVNRIEGDEDCFADIPFAPATPLHLAEVCPTLGSSIGVPNTILPHDTTTSCQQRLSINQTTTQQQRHPVGVRPEFIFASTLLDEIDIHEIGIVLERRSKGGVLVAGLSQQSPLLGSNIQPGDHIIAVNHVLCADHTVERVQEMIQSSKQKVSICVHNAKGDPTLVSNSIMKPQPSSKVGIVLRRRNDIIRIKEMAQHSLFADTLMTTRQRCQSINGISTDHLSAHVTSAFIGRATSRVTIVTELQGTCAASIGVEEHTGGWWHRVTSSVACLAAGKHGAVCTESPLEG